MSHHCKDKECVGIIAKKSHWILIIGVIVIILISGGAIGFYIKKTRESNSRLTKLQ